jgi:hypothetical protein
MIDQADIKPKPVLSREGWNVRRVATFGLMTGFLCSCTAITNPYVTLGENAPVTPSFYEAVKFAQKKAKEFDDRADDLAQFDLITGGSIFASAIAGLGFAAFGAHTDTILGAGLAAGTSSGARSFIPYSQRVEAYKMGSGALHCAVTAIGLGVSIPSEPPSAGDPQKKAPSKPSKKHDVSNPSKTASAEDPQKKAPRSKEQSHDLLRQYLDELTQADSPQALSVRSGGRSNTVELMPMAEVMTRNAVRAGDSRLIADTADVKAEIRQFNRATLKVQAAVDNLKAVTTAAADNRGQRLMGATKVVIIAVADQITAARLNPDAAVDQLKIQSTAMAKQIREAAIALEKAAAELKEKQEDTTETIDDTVAEAAKGNMANVSSDASTLKASVEQTGNEVAELSAVAKKILSLVDLSTACFGKSES